MPEVLYGPENESRFFVPWKGSFLEACVISDVGRKRTNNEDSCLVSFPEDEGLRDARGELFAVADGMGGASAGEYASRKTLECVCAKYYDKGVHLFVPAAMRAAVEAANAFVYAEASSKRQYAGMGTTLSALAVLGSWGYIAQVGDSRVYLLRQGQSLRQITHDHSLVAEQIRSGLINESDARNHSLKNLITRAVGIKDTIEVDLYAVELQQGDTLLLCSDGLCNMVSDEAIETHLQQNKIEDVATALVENALEEGGTDNITLIAVRVFAPPPATHYQYGGKLFTFEPPGFFARVMRRLRGRGA